MSDLIYKRFKGHRWTAAWDQLPQADKDAWLAKLDEALAAAGGMRFVLIACDSAHALQTWDTFGIEVFPDRATLEQHRQRLDALNLSQYVELEEDTATDLGPLGLNECVDAKG